MCTNCAARHLWSSRFYVSQLILFLRGASSNRDHAQKEKEYASRVERIYFEWDRALSRNDAAAIAELYAEDTDRVRYVPTDFSGATNEGFGLIDFPSLAEYEAYRARLANHPLHKENAATLEKSGALLSIYRALIQRVEPRPKH